MRKKSLADALAQWVRRRGIGILGLPAEHVTLAVRKAIAKHVTDCRLRACDDGLLMQRAAKQQVEVEAIRRALRIQQMAFERTLRFIKPGKTENEVAAYLEYQMRQLGADGASFPTIGFSSC